MSAYIHTDAYILEQARNNNNFEPFYMRFYGMSIIKVMKLIGYNDAPDIVQQAMMKAHQHIGSFDESISKLNTWFGKILKNKLIDYYRTKKSFLDLDDFLDPDDDSQAGNSDRFIGFFEDQKNISPDESIHLSEISSALMQYVAHLAPDYKQLIEAHYFDGMSYDEMAKAFNLPIGRVRDRLFKARKLLREGMQHDERFHNYSQSV